MNLVQRSPDWFAARSKMDVTGSEFAIVYGVSNYDTISGLWRKKRGEKIEKPNPYKERIMQWGTDHEKDAIKELELYLKKPVTETGLWAYEKDCKLGTSPDGLIMEEDKPIAIVECKCPWKKIIYASIKEEGIIPPDHWVQVQGQLNICNVDLGYYVVWTPEKHAIVQIPRNRYFWKYYLLPEIQKFRQNVNENKKPKAAKKKHHLNLIKNFQTQENYKIDIINKFI